MIGKHHRLRVRSGWGHGTGYSEEFLSWTLERAAAQGYDLGPDSPLEKLTMKELDWLINANPVENKEPQR